MKQLVPKLDLMIGPEVKVRRRAVLKDGGAKEVLRRLVLELQHDVDAALDDRGLRKVLRVWELEHERWSRTAAEHDKDVEKKQAKELTADS